METFLQMFRVLVAPLFVLLILVVLVNVMGSTMVPLLVGCGLWMIYCLIRSQRK